jgi:hypothetical protein
VKGVLSCPHVNKRTKEMSIVDRKIEHSSTAVRMSGEKCGQGT